MGDPIGTGVVTGAVTRIYTPHTGTFRKGKPGGPGRPRGARNRVGAELAKEILQAAADTGFMVRDEHGNWKASNEGASTVICRDACRRFLARPGAAGRQVSGWSVTRWGSSSGSRLRTTITLQLF